MNLNLHELAEVFDGDSDDDGKVSQASGEETGAVRDLEQRNGHLELHQRGPSLGAPVGVIKTPKKNLDTSLAGPSTGGVGGPVPEFVQRLLAEELKEWTLAQGERLSNGVRGDIRIAQQAYAARLEILAKLPCRTDDGGAAATTVVGVEDDDDANLAAHALCNSLGWPGSVVPKVDKAEVRKGWTSAEDELIRSSVQRLGCKKWRAIAAQLPGRSDDAVRNRWSRLFGDGPACGSHEKTCSHAAVRTQASEQGQQQAQHTLCVARPQEGQECRRKSWTRVEDDIIMQSVAELGHAWCAIGRRLPARHRGVRDGCSRLGCGQSYGHCSEPPLQWPRLASVLPTVLCTAFSRPPTSYGTGRSMPSATDGRGCSPA